MYGQSWSNGILELRTNVGQDPSVFCIPSNQRAPRRIAGADAGTPSARSANIVYDVSSLSGHPAGMAQAQPPGRAEVGKQTWSNWRARSHARARSVWGTGTPASCKANTTRSVSNVSRSRSMGQLPSSRWLWATKRIASGSQGRSRWPEATMPMMMTEVKKADSSNDPLGPCVLPSHVRAARVARPYVGR